MTDTYRKTWEGSALDMGDRMDPYGIKSVTLEYDSGDKDVFRPRLREEFGSYELHQLAAYLETISGSMRKQQR